MKTVLEKSQCDLLVDLFSKMFADLATKYPSESASFRRDLKTLVSRVSHEGVSFLTKALPKLGKAVDESLETATLTVPKEFKRSHENRNIPAFLQGMFSAAYGPDGNLVHMPGGVLADIRQVCYFAYKLELPYTPDLEAAVIDSFIETEKELKTLEIPKDSKIIAVARDVISRVFEGFDPLAITPKHGPGAVATGEKLDEKWVFSRFYDSLHQVFPYYEYFMVGSASELEDRLEWYLNLEQLKAGTAKVVLVPKDSRGPRLISCEPLEYQWIQQGINREVVQLLEKHPLTRGNVNFTSQEINRSLALESSTTRAHATLDLKDASDRVSCQLVSALFPKELTEAFMAARSTATLLPDGRVIELSKFAPMGSAICFSVEATCFWALCVAACSRQSGKHYSQVAKQVYVYGDDIIVPTIYAPACIQALELCGLLVNKTKSFRYGHFRESCGMDAYQGVDVTPIKLHTVWSGKSSDGSAYVSYIAYANALKERGFTKTFLRIKEEIEKVYGRVPYATPQSSFPGWRIDSFFKALILNLEAGFEVRSDAAHHTVLVRAKFLKPRRTPTGLDGWPRLLRNVTQGPGEMPDEVTHPRSVRITRGWKKL